MFGSGYENCPEFAAIADLLQDILLRPFGFLAPKLF
jgi:hypothetical protein